MRQGAGDGEEEKTQASWAGACLLVILLLLLLELFIWNKKPQSMRRGGGGTKAIGGKYEGVTSELEKRGLAK